MNKAIMLSIQPQWCELIASGKKTIEVRKTRPKLETPFKCYIYCTLSGMNQLFQEWQAKVGNYGAMQYWNWGNWGERKGKVIGEFVCDRIERIAARWVFDDSKPTRKEQEVEKATCLTTEDITMYLAMRDGYGWHISDLVIYDTPKELGEFRKPCSYGVMAKCYPDNCNLCVWNTLTRPPQSWCYVEEI